MAKKAKKPAAKKTVKKAAKKVAKKAAPKKAKAKRKPNAAFMAPKQPDAVLGAIVGSKPIPRTQITKQIWVYIKKNGLQDKKNKRMINCDAKLAALAGGKKSMDMFELTKYVSKHIS